MYPSDYRYSTEHEWVQQEGDECRIGITQFAQDELGEVVYVELPDVGQTFSVGDEIGTLESVKAVVELYTPVSGEIIEVNERAADAPEVVNDDPHGDGWLVRIRLDSKAELDDLMDAEAYAEFIAGEGA